MAINLIVKANIKQVAEESGVTSVGGDVAEVLNSKVTELVKEACKRAKENKRNTVMGRDI